MARRWCLQGWCGLILLVAVGFSVSALAEQPRQSVDKLAATLGSGDRDAKRQALYELGRLGKDAAPALPVLLGALDDNDKQVWTGALDVISLIGPDATDAVPALIKALDPGKGRTSRERERVQAQLRIGVALAKIGPKAIPALLEALQSDTTLKRLGAAKALAQMGATGAEGVPGLVKNLGHDDEWMRRETVDALVLIGPASVDPLIAALDMKEEFVRKGAAMALGQIGVPASAALPKLTRMVAEDSSAAVKAAAAGALPRLSDGAPETLAVVIQALRTGNEEVRHSAANALLSNRALSDKARPLLIAELKTSDESRQQAAAAVLGRMGSRGGEAVPLLITCAEANGGESVFASALSQIGAPAVKPLLDRLSGKFNQEKGREWIFAALRGMGSVSVEALVQSLASPSAPVRAGAARLLADLPGESPAIGKALLPLVQDSESVVRAAALRALAARRGEREATLPLLEAGLKDKDPQIRKASAAGLARMGESSKLGVSGLRELLDEPDLATQRSAIEALGKLGKAAASALPQMIKRLETPELRLVSTETIGKIGEGAREVVQPLSDLAGKGPDDVQLSALQALANVGPVSSPAIPLFYKVLQEHENRDVRIQALKALVKLESSDEKLLPVVLQTFEQSTGTLHRESAVALKRFGDRAQPAVPELLNMISRENDRGEALGTLRAMKIEAIPALMAKLDDKAPVVRQFACEALAKLGPKAAEALPALQKKAEQEGEPVKGAAKKAIEQISAP